MAYLSENKIKVSVSARYLPSMPKSDIIRTKLAELAKHGAESKVHKCLCDELVSFANNSGFHHEYNGFPEDKLPDVLLHNDEGYLFIGDAKVSKNETIRRSDTTSQISGYLDEFFKLIDEESISGGVIAINTDDQEAAEEWREWLIEECVERKCEVITINSISDIPFNIAMEHPQASFLVVF